MMPLLYSIIVLLLSINVLLGLQRMSNLAQSRVLASNIPNNVIEENKEEGVTKAYQKSLPKGRNLPPPSFSGIAVLAKNLDPSFIFFTKDENKKVPIASTTKIMTALVAADYFKDEDILTVGSLAGFTGSSMGLKLGEKISFKNLLFGLLLNSGNDASFTIAASYPQGIAGFVAAMNQKAKQLKLSNTNFDNPAGFDNPNHYSTAADLVIMAEEFTKDYKLLQIASTKEAQVLSENGSVVHYLKNLNRLLGQNGVLGIKTGTTFLAKENLVALVEKDGRRTLMVVLGSNDRFLETERLIEWIYQNFIWE